jgi:selenocysteine-specific elongation factor
VTFYVGAAQTLSRIRVLGQQAIEAGGSAFAQLRLAEPIAAFAGDRFIIRRPSPAVTIGGGRILDPHPRRRYRRFDAATIHRLRVLAEGRPDEVMLQQVQLLEPVAAPELLQTGHLSESEALQALETLLREGDVLAMGSEGEGTKSVAMGQRMLMSRAGWSQARAEMTSLLSGFHEAHPLRTGMGRGALRSQLRRRVRRLSDRAFDSLLAQAAQEGVVADQGASVRLAEHQVTFTPQQQEAIRGLLARFEASPYVPPPASECQEQVGEEVLAALVDQGRLIRVSEDVLFTPEAYQDMLEQVRTFIQQQGGITVAQARDLFGSSRRYLLALMEYLDAQGITRRVGDQRVLR